MPPIREMLKPPTNEDGSPKKWSKEEPLSTLQPVVDNVRPMPTPVQPIYRTTPGLRCPMPPLNSVSVDNLRQLTPPGVRTARVISPKFPVSE